MNTAQPVDGWEMLWEWLNVDEWPGIVWEWVKTPGGAIVVGFIVAALIIWKILS